MSRSLRKYVFLLVMIAIVVSTPSIANPDSQGNSSFKVRLSDVCLTLLVGAAIFWGVSNRHRVDFTLDPAVSEQVYRHFHGIRGALNNFYAQHGRYPKTLTELVRGGFLTRVKLVPYYAKEPIEDFEIQNGVPVDPFGEPFVYSVSDDGKRYTLIFKGKDKLVNTADDQRHDGPWPNEGPNGNGGPNLGGGSAKW